MSAMSGPPGSYGPVDEVLLLFDAEAASPVYYAASSIGFALALLVEQVAWTDMLLHLA